MDSITYIEQLVSVLLVLNVIILILIYKINSKVKSKK